MCCEMGNGVCCSFLELSGLGHVRLGQMVVVSLRVVMINKPFRAPWVGGMGWITVPPQTYGGLQWVVANIIDGLLALGHEVVLLGAPGSAAQDGLAVVDIGEPDAIRRWLAENWGRYDVVHDHALGDVFARGDAVGAPYLGTWHMTGRDNYPCNAVYLSESHRAEAGVGHGHPVVRIPVNADKYPVGHVRADFLLFMGRVSPWKGALEAVEFAHNVGAELRIAGPSWEPAYRDQIEGRFGDGVHFEGEVGGLRRLGLLRAARALLVLSQPVQGPWGQVWREPGSTVVSEAAACGTPVIVTDNGCLPELVAGVGVMVPSGPLPSPEGCRRLLGLLPPAAAVRAQAIAAWSHIDIAARYVALYQRVIDGAHW